jgi:large subunit ribosomal protein L31
LAGKATMKPDIHPEFKETRYTCACGSSFTAFATTGGDVHTDICSVCHPFFTGKEKLIDTAGRIEKFNRRYKRTGTQS